MLIKHGKTTLPPVKANHPKNGQRPPESMILSGRQLFASVTRLKPPLTINVATRITRTRKGTAFRAHSAKQRKKKTSRAKPEKRLKLDEVKPHKSLGQKSPELAARLKERIKLARKYSQCNIRDFHDFYDIQRKFLFDHNLCYREDSHLRNKVMKAISDTANTYMRIRKALGLRDYDWTENPHFFLHMGLSKSVWRKAIKWLIEEALKSRPG